MKKRIVLLAVLFALFTPYVQAETGVSRGIFTEAIKNKEPVSDLQQITTATGRVYFFTEISGLSGHAITHRWEYNGKVLAEVSFQVGADRWRTWSSKNLLASWTGKWQVSVLDEGGNIIEQKEFEYIDEPSQFEETDEEVTTTAVSKEDLKERPAKTQ